MSWGRGGGGAGWRRHLRPWALWAAGLPHQVAQCPAPAAAPHHPFRRPQCLLSGAAGPRRPGCKGQGGRGRAAAGAWLRPLGCPGARRCSGPGMSPPAPAASRHPELSAGTGGAAGRRTAARWHRCGLPCARRPFDSRRPQAPSTPAGAPPPAPHLCAPGLPHLLGSGSGHCWEASRPRSRAAAARPARRPPPPALRGARSICSRLRSPAAVRPPPRSPTAPHAEARFGSAPKPRRPPARPTPPGGPRAAAAAGSRAMNDTEARGPGRGAGGPGAWTSAAPGLPAPPWPAPRLPAMAGGPPMRRQGGRRPGRPLSRPP